MPPLTRVALRAAVLLMLLATLLWLAGCGGGADDCRDDFVGPPPTQGQPLPLCATDGRAHMALPNCTTNPELCR